MKIFGDRMKFRTALAGLLLGAVMQSACIGDGIDGETGDPSASSPRPSWTMPDPNSPAGVAPGGVSGTKPDLNIRAAVPPGAGAADKPSQAPAAGTETTQPPVLKDACAEAGVPCAGVCVAAADGQVACKLADRAACAADDECASGSCGSIVVPPDPSDPYDLGYTYVGCK